jgi:hypothetical protein
MYRYYKRCFEKCNASYTGYDGFIGIRAIRDIQPGEEILVSYGDAYMAAVWLMPNMHPDAARKLFTDTIAPDMDARLLHKGYDVLVFEPYMSRKPGGYMARPQPTRSA